MTPSISTALGPFKSLALLDAGSMGRVYLAKIRLLDQFEGEGLRPDL